MEVTFGSIATTFGLIAFLWFGWRVLNFVWLRPKKLEKLLRQQGLNGNPYKVLFGDARETMKMTIEARSRPINWSDDILPRVVPFHHHIIQKYGKNSFSWLGPIPMVNIMDPGLVNEIFLKNDIFKKAELSPLLKFIVDGIVTYEDEKWAKHRKIMNPAFYAQKLKHMLQTMQLSCNEMISKWEMLVSTNNRSSCELDVLPFLNHFTSDVISRTAFGSNYEEGRRIFELQKELIHLMGREIISANIPGWRYVPTTSHKIMRERSKELQALVRSIINKRAESMKSGEIKDDDLLGMLLKSSQNEIEEKGNKDAGMSIEDVVNECKLFYFAGEETTSNLLTWTMILLSKHPIWQVSAREEVYQVFGNNKPDYNGLSRLKIVTMILNEVLRLYPPVVMLSRSIQKERKIGEMNLPAGIQVVLPIILIHHDCGIWGDDAREFKPERFSGGVAKAMKNQPCFFPFGGGPRICIGNNFALMEAKMAMAMILQRFSFELSPSYTHAPSSVITHQPQTGAHLILHKL